MSTTQQVNARLSLVTAITHLSIAQATCNSGIGKVSRTSGAIHQKIVLSDPRKWTFGDIEEYERVLSFFGSKLSTNPGDSKPTPSRWRGQRCIRERHACICPSDGRGLLEIDMGGSRSVVPTTADSYYIGISGTNCVPNGMCAGASRLYIVLISLRSTFCSSMR